MLAKGFVPHLVSFNYGQRHSKELMYARTTAHTLNLPHDVVDLRGLTHLISNSALTAPTIDPDCGRPYEKLIEVPEGHYGEDSMKLTVVPNRNMIMIAIATGIAVNERARCIGLGVHAGDHAVYPDCRPMFVSAMDVAILQGNEGFHNFVHGGKQSKKPEGFADSNGDENRPVLHSDAEKGFFGTTEAGEAPLLLGGPLYTPFLHSSKADIAYRAFELSVPIHDTWSGYKGGDAHCGRCGTCVERLEAIADAATRWEDTYGTTTPRAIEMYDGTEYEDNTFWRTQTA